MKGAAVRRGWISRQSPIALAALLAFAAGGTCAGVEEGKAAFERGHYAVAFDEYRAAAELGNAEAQYRLAVLYVQGRGVAQNAFEAEKWMRKGAERAHPAAQAGLAYMYLTGLGLARDDQEALKWYRKAADLGDPYAQYSLGVLYAQGRGVAMDEAEALNWYRKAADQGNARALEALKRLGQR